MEKFKNQEKMAESFNSASKTECLRCSVDCPCNLLDSEQRKLLQQLLDDRCVEVMERYYSERKKQDEYFIEACRTSMGTLSRCHPCGTAPHERLFLEQADLSIRNCRDEMRQLEKPLQFDPFGQTRLTTLGHDMIDP